MPLFGWFLSWLLWREVDDGYGPSWIAEGHFFGVPCPRRHRYGSKSFDVFSLFGRRSVVYVVDGSFVFREGWGATA